ncbi:MAG: Hsp20/alpha crystallin family protein [Desulfobulbaceae bacterium]|jgi:HSP20 family protein|nr:Hsp20/alpha crystallin family protein [Desulfobulbaceae bacterium]
MSHPKKNISHTYSNLERHLGRVLSHLAVPRMLPLHTVMKAPPVDVYETSDAIILYMELPGIDPAKINVVADQHSVTITGDRPVPSFTDTTCIHQLEIEHGEFSRTIVMPTPIAPLATHSAYKKGYLKVTLPKQKQQTRIKVNVE